MLALVMVWAYFNFSQFLIIWSGNLPGRNEMVSDKNGRQLGRDRRSADCVSLRVSVSGACSTGTLNADSKWLAATAIFILFLRLVDMFYMIGPSPQIGMMGKETTFADSFSWMYLVAPLGVGGIWLWYFLGELLKRPLVPINDPYLEGAIQSRKRTLEKGGFHITRFYNRSNL